MLIRIKSFLYPCLLVYLHIKPLSGTFEFSKREKEKKKQEKRGISINRSLGECFRALYRIYAPIHLSKVYYSYFGRVKGGGAERERKLNCVYSLILKEIFSPLEYFQIWLFWERESDFFQNI